MVAFRNLLLKKRLSLVSYKNRFRYNERPTTRIMPMRQKKHISILIKLNFFTLIYSLCLENGATMTPKRRLLLTLIFACLCFLKKKNLISDVMSLTLEFPRRVGLDLLSSLSEGKFL